jgi:hypothetical protein
MAASGDPECREAARQCAGQSATSPTGQPYEVISTETENTAGTWIQGNITCTATTGAPPAVDQAAIHDAFTKLVPKPTIGTAPPNGNTLVNIQTILWINTPTTVNLGTTPLAGHQVTLTASVQSVTWNFGDHHTDTTKTPGRPFLDNDHCYTTLCPDYYGHIYTTTGTMTITATTTWTGRYNIDGGPFLPITGTATSTPQTTTATVKQSEAILVPNPDQS